MSSAAVVSGALRVNTFANLFHYLANLHGARNLRDGYGGAVSIHIDRYTVLGWLETLAHKAEGRRFESR